MTTPQRPPGMVRVAVDAMGGDHAPQELVQGALQAAADGNVALLLVGDPPALEVHLQGVDTSRLPLRVVPSEGVIQEGEPPAVALRQKPKASVSVAAYLVKEGHADAMVSMGSTGAAMAVALLALGTVEGVERPALGGPILGVAPRTIIVDLGTSVDCRPAQLLSFGVIGAVLAQKLFQVENPRVALLSVGAEEGKGNRQVKEAYELLKAAGLNFIGNVEGTDIASGKAEVVVCDGFVGNILMKFAEGLGATLGELLQRRLAERLPAEEARRLAQEVYGLTNVVEGYGGGPLLGVRGVVVVGHGRARAPQVAQAIRMARYAVEARFVESLEEELRQAHSRAGA